MHIFNFKDILSAYRFLMLLPVTVVMSLLLSVTVSASAPDSLRYEAELRATVSGGKYTPFWLVSNLQGLGSVKKNYGYVRGALFKDIDKNRRFSWGAGVDLVGAWRSTAPFHIHQIYGEVRYRSLGAMLGSKEMWCDHNDPKLSSGSLLFSGNALPIPQLRLGIFDYAPIWGTKENVAVKCYISFGMFTDSSWQKSWAAKDTKYTTDVLLHSKGLWLRFGNPKKSPVTGDVGIEMATQFGGNAYEDGKVIRIKSTFKEWMKAIFPAFSTKESLKGMTRSIEGNVVGEYSFGLNLQPPGKDWSVRAYYEHMFEDHSMLTFEYGWKDGLLGFEGKLPKNPFVTKIVFEYLYSKDQAGAVNNNSSDKVPEQVSGRDNYYNHTLYSGWQHWGMGIGNPLMLSPIYNSDHEIYFYNTRLISHHFGIAGNPTAEIDYRLLFSHTRSWGTYRNPLPEVCNNINGLIEINWHPRKLKGWHGGIGFAFDGGDLIGRNFGFSLTIGKTGLFKI